MKVLKTVKLYMGGNFPRTESGRSFPVNYHGTDKVYAHVCQGSRKDFRNSIEMAKKAQGGWAGRSSYNRGQIVYRMAEMMEGKRDEFIQLFVDTMGWDKSKATKEVEAGIDTLVHYAGFSDKYMQVAGTMNTINGPYHNFTTPGPVGTVTLVERDAFSFSALLGNIAAIILGGNSVVVLLGKECPAVLAPLAEVFATSDLPGGVVNLLTGHLDELASFMGEHREVRSLSFQNENSDIYHQMREWGVDNMKRVIPYSPDKSSLEKILDTVEYKTVWHPIGV